MYKKKTEKKMKKLQKTPLFWCCDHAASRREEEREKVPIRCDAIDVYMYNWCGGCVLLGFRVSGMGLLVMLQQYIT